MACSSGTSTPKSPVDGFMVPTNATIAMMANRSTPGNAMPVHAIKAAPPSRKLRRSCLGAMNPTLKVSNAVPSNDALTMTPIWPELKPIADRYAGKIMLAKPSPSPRTPRAMLSNAMLMRVARVVSIDIRFLRRQPVDKSTGTFGLPHREVFEVSILLSRLHHLFAISIAPNVADPLGRCYFVIVFVAEVPEAFGNCLKSGPFRLIIEHVVGIRGIDDFSEMD